MKIVQTKIDGLKLIEPVVFKDVRGEFIKTFSKELFLESSLDIEIRESYYTLSNKDVIRGMHFQKPPYEHKKLVYVASGKIIDVVLDIRKDSQTYGKWFSIELSSENAKMLLIPEGLAHGFKSLENDTNVSYLQTSCYSAESDDGILYDSFGFDWQCQQPIVSKRDISFKSFTEYQTPFRKTK